MLSVGCAECVPEKIFAWLVWALALSNAALDFAEMWLRFVVTEAFTSGFLPAVWMPGLWLLGRLFDVLDKA